VPESEGKLFVLEISSKKILRLWRERFGEEIYQVISAFTTLPKDFVLEYIGSAPGIEEEYILYYIYDIIYMRSFKRRPLNLSSGILPPQDIPLSF